MSQALLVSESTLTARYQTTIPATVRETLQLKKQDKIRYTIQSDGNVLLSSASLEEDDPILDSFLTFLANDISNYPQRLQPLTAQMKAEDDLLVEGIEVDLNSPLSEEDE
jgi:antitoxin PrlF